MQLFELFFDEEAFDLIMEQTILYAHDKGEENFVLTAKEIKVVLAYALSSNVLAKFIYNKKRSCIQCHASKPLRKNFVNVAF